MTSVICNMCNVQRKGQGNTFLCDCRTRLECPGGCGTWSKKVCVADRAIGGTGCPIWYHWIRRSYKQYPTLGQAASFNSIQFIWSWEDLQPFGVEDRYQSNSIYICNIYISPATIHLNQLSGGSKILGKQPFPPHVEVPRSRVGHV